jgi:hypothetical protein
MTSKVEQEAEAKAKAVSAAGTGAGTADLESALATLARFVSESDLARYDGGDASVLVERFTRIERLAATGKSLAATRAAEARQACAGGQPTPAHRLSEVTGESLGESPES